MTTVCIFVPNLNKPILEYQKTVGKKNQTNIITRIYCPELICLWKKKNNNNNPLKSLIS